MKATARASSSARSHRRAMNSAACAASRSAAAQSARCAACAASDRAAAASACAAASCAASDFADVRSADSAASAPAAAADASSRSRSSASGAERRGPGAGRHFAPGLARCAGALPRALCVSSGDRILSNSARAVQESSCGAHRGRRGCVAARQRCSNCSTVRKRARGPSRGRSGLAYRVQRVSRRLRVPHAGQQRDDRSAQPVALGAHAARHGQRRGGACFLPPRRDGGTAGAAATPGAPHCSQAVRVSPRSSRYRAVNALGGVARMPRLASRGRMPRLALLFFPPHGAQLELPRGGPGGAVPPCCAARGAVRRYRRPRLR